MLVFLFHLTTSSIQLKLRCIGFSISKCQRRKSTIFFLSFNLIFNWVKCMVVCVCLFSHQSCAFARQMSPEFMAINVWHRIGHIDDRKEQRKTMRQKRRKFQIAIIKTNYPLLLFSTCRIMFLLYTSNYLLNRLLSALWALNRSLCVSFLFLFLSFSHQLDFYLRYNGKIVFFFPSSNTFHSIFA